MVYELADSGHLLQLVTQAQRSNVGTLLILINFLLALFFSFAIYKFVISRQPDLKDPLAFLAVSMMVYIATAAFCRYIRYIPLFFVFLRGKHERV